MSVKRQRLGRWGERVATRHLRRKGLRIIARNWRCGLGELDMVALDRGVLVFVEVRTSRAGFAGGGIHTVGPQKRRKLVQLAERYRAETGLGGEGMRFDVVGVTRKGWIRREVTWVKHAFEA